jgi:hypothetical protein
MCRSNSESASLTAALGAYMLRALFEARIPAIRSQRSARDSLIYGFVAGSI